MAGTGDSDSAMLVARRATWSSSVITAQARARTA
jgi:hypothetical protein